MYYIQLIKRFSLIFLALFVMLFLFQNCEDTVVADIDDDLKRAFVDAQIKAGGFDKNDSTNINSDSAIFDDNSNSVSSQDDLNNNETIDPLNELEPPIENGSAPDLISNDGLEITPTNNGNFATNKDPLDQMTLSYVNVPTLQLIDTQIGPLNLSQSEVFQVEGGYQISNTFVDAEGNTCLIKSDYPGDTKSFFNSFFEAFKQSKEETDANPEGSQQVISSLNDEIPNLEIPAVIARYSDTLPLVYFNADTHLSLDDESVIKALLELQFEEVEGNEFPENFVADIMKQSATEPTTNMASTVSDTCDTFRFFELAKRGNPDTSDLEPSSRQYVGQLTINNWVVTEAIIDPGNNFQTCTNVYQILHTDFNTFFDAARNVISGEAVNNDSGDTWQLTSNLNSEGQLFSTFAPGEQQDLQAILANLLATGPTTLVEGESTCP